MKSGITVSRKADIALWIIWTVVFMSLIIIQLAISGSKSDEASLGTIALAFVDLPFVAIALATAIRWLAIPRLKSIGWILFFSIVGIWFAESAFYLQVFLIGERFENAQMIVFVMSLLAVAQFAPIYLKRARSAPIPS